MQKPLEIGFIIGYIPPATNQFRPSRRPLIVKSSKSQFISRVHKIPELRFEDQQLTSYAGLVIIQEFFMKLNHLRGAITDSNKWRSTTGIC